MLKAVCVGLFLFAATTARADGAFPDEMQIFLPPDQPHRIIVTTTFGILDSTDDGATWRWVCEQAVTSALTAQLYQVGPPPDHVIYASVSTALTMSRDDACSFSVAGGVLDHAHTVDVFADPTPGSKRVLVLATPLGDGGPVPSGVFRSTDAGQSWEPNSLFTDDMGGILNGVEISASNPQTIYLTMKRVQPLRPFLVRSTDGGTTWTTIDLSSVASGLEVRMIGVDSQDANKVYLRAIDPINGDHLIITTDGGGSFRLAMTVYGPYVLPDAATGVGGASMTAFLRRTDGTMLVGSRVAGGWISTDGGMTFSKWTGAPHTRALGERAGQLFACGDNWLDQFVVGVSSDGGATWRPLLRFDQICGPKQCTNVQAVCATPWNDLVTLFEIPPTVCGQAAPDGGTGSGGGGGGCGCSVGGRTMAGWAVLAALVAIAVSRISARRRRP
jgi:MYXO-CTERM domain-containing protein